MIHFKILPDHQLVILHFSGVVTPEEVINSLEVMVKDVHYRKSYSSIIDLREADLSYDSEGLRKTLQYILRTNAAKRRTAYLTSHPRHVIPPSMMKGPEFKMPMDVRIFSTVEPALDWLVLDEISAEDYHQIVQTMKSV